MGLQERNTNMFTVQAAGGASDGDDCHDRVFVITHSAVFTNLLSGSVYVQFINTASITVRLGGIGIG